MVPSYTSTPSRITRHAPMLGEHSRELLKEYHYTDEEIDAFLAQGVIEEANAAVHG